MAFREVTMLEVKEVLRRWLAGEAKKAIARAVGVSRNTVRAYVKAGVKCGLEGQSFGGGLIEIHPAAVSRSTREG